MNSLADRGVPPGGGVEGECVAVDQLWELLIEAWECRAPARLVRRGRAG